MFLDSWLMLGVWGLAFLVFILLLVLAFGFVFVRGIQLRKMGKQKLSWFLIILSGIFFLGLINFGYLFFSDNRPQKRIVLDLRESKTNLLTELNKNCEEKDNCEMISGNLDVTVIFIDGLELTVFAKYIRWSIDAHSDIETANSISIWESKDYTLQSAHDSLIKYTSIFSKKENMDVKKSIESTVAWVLEPGDEDSSVYSDRATARLRGDVDIQILKNLTDVTFEYVIYPSR